MSGSKCIVPTNILSLAKPMIQDSNGESTKIGIELLLTHDISADTLNANAALGRADAGHLLERGLRILRSMPFQALGVSHDCTSAEVRKAFKKQALKYHPDKNPRTTPLFVTMKAVSDRLAETGERMRAADVAKRVPAAGPPPTGAASEPSAKYDSSKTASTSRDSNMSSSTSSSETAHGTKQSNANNAKANGQESNANANGSTHWFSHIYGRNTGGRERESRYSNGSCDSEKLPTRDSNANARQYSSQQNTPRYSDIRDDMKKARQQAERQAEADRKARGFAEQTRKQRMREASMPHEAFFEEHERIRKEESDKRQKQREENMSQKVRREKDRTAAAANLQRQARGSIHEEKPHDCASDAPSSRQQSSASYAALVPRPKQLRCALLGPQEAEFVWTVSRITQSDMKYLAEVNWRRQLAMGRQQEDWQSAGKFITGTERQNAKNVGSSVVYACRKKNLDPSTTYEFRFRTVENIEGGTLGSRSAWSVIIVTTKPPGVEPTKMTSPEQENGRSQKDGPSAPGMTRSSSASIPLKEDGSAQKYDGFSGKMDPHKGSVNGAAPQSKCYPTSPLPRGPKPTAAAVAGGGDLRRNEAPPPNRPPNSRNGNSTEGIGIAGANGGRGKENDASPGILPPLAGHKRSGFSRRHSDFGIAPQGADQSKGGSNPDTKLPRVHVPLGRVSGSEAAAEYSSDWLGRDRRSTRQGFRPVHTSDSHADLYENARGASLRQTSSSVERPGQARKKTMHTFYEQHDEQGHAYYYNASTGQSQWECPEWVQYIDPHTQLPYYVNLTPYGGEVQESRWDMPSASVAKLVRKHTHAHAHAHAHSHGG